MMEKLRKNSVSLLALLLIVILMVLPTGYEDAAIYKDTERVRVKVLSTDESRVINNGLIQSGEQYCQVKVLDGKFKGQEARAVNMLSGSLESDKIYETGDVAQVVISHKDGEILSITMTDHFRIDKELLLAGLFVLLLVLFAGRVGLRAVYSFIITVLTIWKIMVPAFLKGINPIWCGIAITAFLTVLIIFLVYGWDKKDPGSQQRRTSGRACDLHYGLRVHRFISDPRRGHGILESLLYAGYQDLNLTRIFMSGIFIGASGAMMDLAVDITSAVNEVIQKKPEIGWREAARSGMNVGRAAMGTMTTTLLLAYSGGYIALLMTFMAQGTPIDHIFNYKYVSAEILDTVVGSFGLVTVAPFTALTSALLLTGRSRKEKEVSL